MLLGKYKNYILVSVLWLFSASVVCAQTTCYAHLRNDTLRIGNSLIERTFLWNDGWITTTSLTHCSASWSNKVNNGRSSDAYFSQSLNSSEEGTLSVTPIKGDGRHAGFLQIVVETHANTLQMRRVFRIYDDCPVIACDYYLCGRALGTMEEVDSSADAVNRKNIENSSDMQLGQVHRQRLDHLSLGGNAWQVRVVEFFDATDWNNNLVQQNDFVSYRQQKHRGNLLMAVNQLNHQGFFWLKEAPCSSSQLNYGGADFMTSFGDFECLGLGINEKGLDARQWVKAYSCVLGVFDGGEHEALMALRCYQKKINVLDAKRDEMMMANTWGDRSQDEKVDEAFCIAELEAMHRLGLNCLQIDDGWQSGISPNAKFNKGTFKDIWKQDNYWTPNPRKFPRGLKPIVDKARRLGIRMGLWFNPSVQNDFADWQRDASVLINLYQQYGISVFKIDGLNITSKLGEQRLRAMFDSVEVATRHHAVINLDVTAGCRSGYHTFNTYGNIFLENRYTDWGNYYPWLTLRNLWQLSRYVPVERLQIEFLNKWRNADKYASDDWLAPAHYRFDYLFAITMAAQPLAWMETSSLPDSAFTIADVVRKYQHIQHDFHRGTILPIGDEPSGASWTGFQSIIDAHHGYLLVFRESVQGSWTTIPTWLPEGSMVRTSRVLGNGDMPEVATVGQRGVIQVNIPRKNDYILFQYQIQ